MRASTPSQTTGYAAVGLLVAGLVAVSSHQIPEWRRWMNTQAEHERIAEYERFTTARNEFNRHLVVDLTAGRVPLAHAVELMVRMSTDRDGYLEVIRTFYPAPTVEESLAQNLIFRVEAQVQTNELAQPGIVAQLKDEYTTLFGHRPPPNGDELPSSSPEEPFRVGEPGAGAIP